ncbi:MAG TPA: T9SS type A sorting domain-containing protein [Bacteroidia bacterium]|nr:T9SS type A sorting domain-containing protein [Bacteroidia bacterium]
MKKVYLLLLVTFFAFAGARNSAIAGCSTTIDVWDVLSPTSSLYPFGIVTGSYSGSSVLSGDLFYEGNYLQTYESVDGTIFLFDLLPGNYIFNFCGGSESFTIFPIPCDISILNISSLDVSGAGCSANGQIDLTVGSSSMGMPYYYNLTEILSNIEYTGTDDGFGIISITGLPPGVYSLFVSTDMDVLNSTCNANDLIIINEPSCDMAIQNSGSNSASAQGASDGSIYAEITGSSCIPTAPGGTPVYNVYVEFNGGFLADMVYNSITGDYELTGLAAGDYTIVADNSGDGSCFVSTVITVDEPTGCNLASPTVLAVNTTICNGAPAILSVPDIYASYQWVYNGSYLIPVGFVGTDHEYWAYLEGAYAVIVTDNNGCTATSNEVFVSAPLSPQINFPDTIYSCTNQVTITAPSAFDTFIWSTNATTSSITVTTDGWYGLGAGINALTCGVVDTFYVSLNNTAPTAEITVIGNNPFCTGTSITLQSNSAVNNLWNTGATTQSISVNSTGNYTLQVSNTIGCTATASVDVTSQNCVPSTQLANGVCGNMSYVRTSAITCVTVSGATQYEWEFSNNNGVYATKLSTTNYIGLHGVSPILNWGTTWTVRVRAYIGSNAGVFSNPCTIGIITDPAITGVPLTQLRVQDCGKLNYRINADNRIITTPISGAIQYEFEFTDMNNVVVAVVQRVNNVLYFNTMNPILPFPAQYNVRTKAKLGSVWGSYGQACLIGIIGLNRDAVETESSEDISVVAPYFDLTAMPNPYDVMTSIVINSSIDENVYIQFYDMTGKLVDDIKVTTNSRFDVGANLSKGIYLLKAKTDSGNQLTTKLVKTN